MMHTGLHPRRAGYGRGQLRSLYAVTMFGELDHASTAFGELIHGQRFFVSAQVFADREPGTTQKKPRPFVVRRALTLWFTLFPVAVAHVPVNCAAPLLTQKVCEDWRRATLSTATKTEAKAGVASTKARPAAPLRC